MVRDEGSLNGVYVRIRGSATVTGRRPVHLWPAGLSNRCDAQRQLGARARTKRISTRRPVARARSESRKSSKAGWDGIVCCAQEQTLEIGREDCDINFPNDLHMSPRHAKVEDERRDPQARRRELSERNVPSDSRRKRARARGLSVSRSKPGSSGGDGVIVCSRCGKDNQDHYKFCPWLWG